MIFCLLCEKKLDKFETIHKTVRGDTSNNIKVIKCNECGHVQLNKSFGDLIEHYNNDSQYKEIKETFKKTDKQIYQERYALAKSVIQRLKYDYKIPIHQDTKIMDFGSGTQILSLLIATQYNCAVDSVEISKLIVDNGLKYFEDIYKNCNDKLKIIIDDNFIKNSKNKYDVITMIHVLEHLNNLDIVKNLYDVLNYKGKLIIEVPNENDIMLKISEKYKNITYQIHHLSYFNENTFKILLEKLSIKNYNIHYYHRYDNIKNFLGFVLDKPITSCVGDPSTSDDSLHNFWLSGMTEKKCTDCMAVVISKE